MEQRMMRMMRATALRRLERRHRCGLLRGAWGTWTFAVGLYSVQEVLGGVGGIGLGGLGGLEGNGAWGGGSRVDEGVLRAQLRAVSASQDTQIRASDAELDELRGNLASARQESMQVREGSERFYYF